MKGGSPTALLPPTLSSRLPSGQSSTLKCSGTSPVAGILYVLGACVASRPLSFHTSCSVVSQPMPWMKPPSIWPMSIAGLKDVPTSCRMSTFSTRLSPVSVSMATSVQAAP
jgi:hypothetical protein